jgi:hypothetical protein
MGQGGSSTQDLANLMHSTESPRIGLVGTIPELRCFSNSVGTNEGIDTYRVRESERAREVCVCVRVCVCVCVCGRQTSYVVAFDLVCIVFVLWTIYPCLNCKMTIHTRASTHAHTWE